MRRKKRNIRSRFLKRNSSYITMFGFLALIFGIGILNLTKFVPAVFQAASQEETYFSDGGGRLEEEYRSGFLGRQSWINLYGGVQKLLNRRIIGDMEFVKMKNGLMDYADREFNVIPFAKEMTELKAMLDARGIPLLYIQMPARDMGAEDTPACLVKTRTYYQQIREITDQAGIICMDEEEILKGEGAPTPEEFFFKTDVHTTTRGEIWMAEKIAEKLTKEYGIVVSDVIQYQDDRFDVHSHTLKGNLIHSAGRYYNGTDVFEEYIPKEETRYRAADLKGEWEETGSFEEVVMNRYDELEQDEDTIYWVTNYVRYGVPAYYVENLGSDGPSLLVVCDSMCYRTLAFLSLQCSRITVVDPRFYEGEDLLGEALECGETYDAMIYLHGTFYTTRRSMFGSWSLE